MGGRPSGRGSGKSGSRPRGRRRGAREGTRAGAPAEREFSCGGVVILRDHCLVITPVRPDGRQIATLPKGHPEEGEDPPTAAIREIREETGVVARVTGRLGEVVYWYQRDGKRIRKTVRMYLCAYVGGEPVADGFEVSAAYWMPLERALHELAFPGDREMIRKAMARKRDGR